MNITVVIVDRANYGRLKPLLIEMDEDSDIDLSIVCCGSTVLKRFHEPAKDIAKTFHVTHYIYHEVEGSNTVSCVNSMAMLMPQLMMAFRENDPDFVLIIGDRYEALAAATVAAMMQLCIIHVQGGEHSGNIDNCIRHAITKLSHYHLPATNDAFTFLQQLGENKDTILAVGCPAVEYTKMVKADLHFKNHILCAYHPEDCVNNEVVIDYLLETLSKYGMPVIMMWPNIDPNSEGINRHIRRYMATHNADWLTMVVNYNPVAYMKMLTSVRGCIGNSSSFVRDTSFFGTPTIIMGDRQIGRIKTENVVWIRSNEYDSLYKTMLEHFSLRFAPSNYYGTNGVCDRFIKRLKEVSVYKLKVDIHV